MARENPTWGEEYIANELKLKLDIPVSPRTVGKHLAQGSPPTARSRPALAYLRAQSRPCIVACDVFVVVTARLRILYVFVLMELGRRRILHVYVTNHPSAEWTPQELREALPGDHPFRFLIHDRDSTFSQELNEGVAAMGVRVLRTPFRAPRQCCLRTPDLTDPSEVSGFPHPAGTAAFEGHSQSVGTPLQSRTRFT